MGQFRTDQANELVKRRIAVWGIGPASHGYIREGEATHEAQEMARAEAFDLTQPDAWAVMVLADEHSLDAHTRHDRAVVGWSTLPVDVDEEEEPETYTTRGDVRGACGHAHRTVGAAVECRNADRRGCKRVGGYSDREVVRTSDGAVPLAEVQDYERLPELT